MEQRRMKITIELDQPSDFGQLIASLKNTVQTRFPTATDLYNEAKRREELLRESARRLAKTVDETATSIAPAKEVGTMPVEHTTTTVTADPKTKVKLQGAIAGKLSTVAPKKSVKAPKEVPAKKAHGPTKGKAPVCVDAWAEDELSLLKTCKTADDAKFVYHSHFGDARNDNAVYQKWWRMNKDGEVLHVGDKVTCADDSFDGKVSDITGFTDDRTKANVRFTGDPAMYQIAINNLCKVN